MLYKYKPFFILLFIFAIRIGYSQHSSIYVETLSMKQGLPNDITHYAIQDNKGFVWIATNYGFARFDGENVHTFATKNKENSVVKCFQDVNGLIWAVLATGIDILNPLDNTSQTIQEHFGTLPFRLEKLKQIINDSEGNIYLLLNNGDIYRYNGAFSKVAVFPYNRESDPPIELLTFIADEDCFWLSFRYYQSFLLYRLGFDGKIEAIRIPAPVKKMQLSKKGQLWLLLGEDKASGDLYTFENKSLKPVLLPGIIDIQNFIIDSDEQIWCVNQQQITVFNRKKQPLSRLSYNKLTTDAVKGAHLMVDGQNNVWFCTSVGIFIFHLQKVFFTNYLNQEQPFDTRGIYIDEAGNIFVNQESTYKISEKGVDTLAPETRGVGLLKIGNKLLIGNYWDYVGEYNMDKGTYEKKYYVQDETLKTNVNSVFQSSKTGRIWTAGATGIGYIDTSSNKILDFNRYNEFYAFKNQAVSHFYENEEGIWLATSNGLYLLDETNGIIAEYNTLFPSSEFVYVYEDKAGVFWLGTQGDGLIRWDRAKDEIQQFTNTNGLSNNVIYAVYEDDFGYLWLPSNYGLMRFNKQTHEVTTYLPEDGLPHHEFNIFSHARAPDGRLFFGGLGGITSFHPRDFVEDTLYQIPLVITDFQKQNAQGGLFQNFTKEALAHQALIIHPDETSFTLQFALLDYKRFYDKRYAYKIEGLDKDWNYLEDNHIRIGRLPYGKYILHLKGRRYNEPWSKNEIHIPLIVVKPFYLKTWFLTSLFLMLAAIIYFGAKLRVSIHERDRARLKLEVKKQTQQLQAQADQLKEMDTLKSRLFANISHDFRTPLTLILTPLEDLLQRIDLQEAIKKTLTGIKNNTNNLLSLVEELIDLSKFENNQIELDEQPVHLKKFVERVFAAYESYAQIQEVQYKFSYQTEDSLTVLMDRPKVEKILNNLLSNAFKFVCENGKIELIVTEKKAGIQIQVKNDGEGIAPEHLAQIFDRYFRGKTLGTKVEAGAGIGLSIAKEYARIMGGDLTVESQPGVGSIFTLALPKKLVDSTPLPIEMTDKQTVFKAHENGFIHNNHDRNSISQVTILVVEDNLEMQALFHNILVPHYKILEAFDGLMALQKLENEKVDCIITDIMMPKMDGFEFINNIKSNEDTSWIPVIAVTALADKQKKLEALRIGIDDYLTKPFCGNELLVRVQNLLHRNKNQVNTTKTRIIQSAEQKWLMEVETQALILLDKFPDFNLLELADRLHISDSNLRRRIKRITGLTANNYIKEIRLQHSRELLENKAHFTVAEVSYAVGFSSTSYFIKVFTERFGKLPSEYLKEKL